MPFLDRRFMEFALTVPPSEQMSNDVGKLLLRRAMSGLVPDLVLRRTDKGGTVDQMRRSYVANRRAILTCVESAQFESLDVVDTKKLGEEVNAFIAGKDLNVLNLHASVSLAQWACANVHK